MSEPDYQNLSVDEIFDVLDCDVRIIAREIPGVYLNNRPLVVAVARIEGRERHIVRASGREDAFLRDGYAPLPEPPWDESEEYPPDDDFWADGDRAADDDPEAGVPLIRSS